MWLLLFSTASVATLTIAQPARWALAIFQCMSFLCLLVTFRRKNLIHFATPALWFTAVPAMVAILQLSFGTSASPGSTLEACLTWTALAALALSVEFAFEELEHFLQAFAGFGGILAVVVLVQSCFGLAYEDRVGPFQNRNTYASFVELAIPPAAWSANRSKNASWIWWSAIAAMASSVAASASRAGSILVLAELLGILLIQSKKVRWKHLASIAALAVIWLAIATPVELWTRLQFEDPLAHRREIYTATTQMVIANPFKGIGIGAFAMAYPGFAAFDAGALVNYAHNDWLQWTAEGGIFAGGVMLAAALFACRNCLQHPWQLGPPIVFLHGLVDFPMQRVGLAAWIILLMAGTASTKKRGGHHHHVASLSRDDETAPPGRN